MIGARSISRLLDWEVPVAITKEDVLHVAKLARLEIPEDEIDRVRDQLGAILEAVGKVGELDLSDVEPTSHPLDLVNVWAEDEPRPSLPREEALANAPDPADGAFRVPAVGQ
jgi:aspartyl-tRNA(Asn)/glutamyl-tRNA(Gln) amidotransferase subunit C